MVSRKLAFAVLLLLVSIHGAARAERALVMTRDEGARRALRGEARVERELRGGAILEAEPAKLRELSSRGYSVRILEDPRRLHLAAGTIEVGVRTADLAAAGEGVRPWLVALDGPGRDESVARLAALGSVVGPVPPYGWLVRIDSRKLTALAAVSGVVGLEPMRAPWKIAGRIERGSAPIELSILGYPDVPEATLRNVVASFGTVVESGATPDGAAVRLRALPAVLDDLASRPEVQWVDSLPRGAQFNNEVRVVLQTERAHDNANQAFYNPVYAIGVKGYDQTVAMTDSGILASHEQFQGPCFTGDPAQPCVSPMQQYKTYSICGETGPLGDESDHGTEVAATLAGNSQGASLSWDTANGFDGVAFKSRLIVQDYRAAGSTEWSCLPYPAYIGSTFLRAYGEGARVHNASWGHNIANELDPVDHVGPQSGRYSLLSWNLDRYVRNHPDSVVVFAAGNTGKCLTPGPCYIPRSVSDEAQAKNVISVGGSQNGAARHVMYRFSSHGPTNDCTGAPWDQPCSNPGRIKPDVLAPGDGVTSAAPYTDTSYRGDNEGTSFAAPGISGAAALVRDYFAQELYPTESSDWEIANPLAPSAALVKAMLINSTVFLQNSTGYEGNSLDGLRGDAWPNYTQGYGRPALDTVLEQAGYRQLKVYEDDTCGDTHPCTQVATTDVWEQTPTLRNEWSAACSTLRVTLVWTDPPPMLGAGRVLVNNLDLEVLYGGQTHVGNEGLIKKHLDPVLNEESDSLNNVEDVFIPLGAASTATIRPTIRVTGTNVTAESPQRFAVVVTYGPCQDRTPCNGAGGCYAGPGDVIPGSGPPPACPGQEYSDDECIGLYCEEPFPDCDPPTPEPPVRPIEHGRPAHH
jgi:subtilisin family serine protease